MAGALEDVSISTSCEAGITGAAASIVTGRSASEAVTAGPATPPTCADASVSAALTGGPDSTSLAMDASIVGGKDAVASGAGAVFAAAAAATAAAAALRELFAF